MSADDRGSGAGGSRLPPGAFIQGFAMVLALVTASLLGRENLKLLQYAEESRDRRSIAPAAGSLSGHAIGGSRWVAEEGRERPGILFGLAPPGSRADAMYWNEVASALRTAAPDLQLVGLCMPVSRCDSLRPDSGITLLTDMDPAQVHTLAIATQEGRFLTFRGKHVTGSIAAPEDVRELLPRLAGLTARQGLAGGA